MVNRKDTRLAFKTFVTPFYTSAKAVYEYMVGDFESQSPVVCLSSSGSENARLTKNGFNTGFYINVHHFVLYADLQDANAPIYYEKDAENTLDDLDFQLRTAMAGAGSSTEWKNVHYENRSQADDPVMIGGELYLHEVTTLRFGDF